ncbi:hypothetical protein RoPhRRH1_gp03 [Rhodococcus phage RRH1]|uniref:Uncharacterized protein n=1 Tax=Rhodococcus phage RRH1 TaxID=1109717 RepID=G9FGU8_9CAUD|nr:hypothetical protein RoPhRRH1_gp03 [Rhodococcus phage RRH1]AEV51837.1 hypothetical protein [Rhodococcus phage RRH1]
MERVRIDATDYSVVAVCDTEGCSWRALAHSRPSAQRLAAFHCRFAHDDPDTARLLRRSAAATDRRVIAPARRRRGGAGSSPGSTRPGSAGSSARRTRRRFDGDDPAPAQQ